MKSKILQRSDLVNKVAVIVGTRPGIIKFSPIIRELVSRGIDYTLIHTGQHYSSNMDQVFFDELELPSPNFTNDNVQRCEYHGEQTAEMMKGIELALLESRPSHVIVNGDANTNLAGALAARKLVNIRLAHMEAGLRSNDWRMPEEHNRVMIDHISDILYVPTQACLDNLNEEKIKGRKMLTGNAIVDAVYQNRDLARKKSAITQQLNIQDEPFSLLTLHREENVDDENIASAAIENISKLPLILGHKVVFPMHPRTVKRLKQLNKYDQVCNIPGVRVIEPVGYLDMMALMEAATYIFTDSGGIQEEACILGRPCITLRENTERPETVSVSANRVVGMNFKLWQEAIDNFEDMEKFNWENPYGDGTTAKRIVDDLLEDMVSKP